MGVKQSLPNPLHHTLYIPQHFIIPKSQHAKTLHLQTRRAHRIISKPLGMLSAIHFDDQLAFNTNEIGDVISKRMLTTKFVPLDLP